MPPEMCLTKIVSTAFGTPPAFGVVLIIYLAGISPVPKSSVGPINLYCTMSLAVVEVVPAAQALIARLNL